MSHRTAVRAGTLLAATLALLLCIPAAAQEDAQESAPEEEEESTGRFSGIIQADFTNAYVFRGIMQERHGFIAQPWAELYFSLFSSDDGPIRDVTIGGGVWNSFHTEETLAAHGPHSLYETDWYPLLSLDLAGGLNLTTIYYFYSSPNGAFDTVEELNFKLSWDDSEVLGRWALNPWVNFAVETHLTSLGDEEGSGVQMGIAPTLYEFEHDRYPVTLSIPVEVGLAIEDYYEEEDGSENTFGYVSFGMAASMPLAFMPEGYGDWAMTVSAKGFYFSDTLADVNEGDHWHPVFMASVGVEF